MINGTEVNMIESLLAAICIRTLFCLFYLTVPVLFIFLFCSHILNTEDKYFIHLTFFHNLFFSAKFVSYQTEYRNPVPVTQIM